MVKKHLCSVSSLIFAFACGAPPASTVRDDGVPGGDRVLVDDGEPSLGDGSELLAELSVDDSTIAFRLIPIGDGSHEILITEEFRSIDRMSTLTEDYGHLTSLELFLAFAPDGTEPPAALLAAHEHEARGLGRSGEGLTLQVVDGKHIAINKARPGICTFNGLPAIQPLAWDDAELTQQIISIDGLAAYTCLGQPQKTGLGGPTNCERFHPSRMLYMVACNDTSSTNNVTVFFHGNTFVDPGTSLAPGAFKTFRLNPVVPPPTVIINRWMALQGTNNTANPLNTHWHMGAVSKMP